MNEKPLAPHQSYLLKHTTQTVPARVEEIRQQVDIQTLDGRPAAQLRLNEIGVVSLECQRPLFFDPYRRNRATGGFVLIHAITNETVAAGVIRHAETARTHKGHVTAADRESRFGHPSLAVCLPAGSLGTAQELERMLFDRGCVPVVLDYVDAPAAALRALAEAGLIGIIVGGNASQLAATLGDVLSPDCIISATAGDSAANLRKKLIAAGKLETRSQPFREGEGI
jgi:hypothetical protein